MPELPPELADAVLAAPTDDAPRLACADWFDEQGDPEMGEYVRLQVRLAGMRSWAAERDEWAALSNRVAELEALTRERRFAGLIAACGESGFTVASNRGFVRNLNVTGVLTADVLRAAAGHPTLELLWHSAIAEGEQTRLRPQDLALLVPLRNLAEVRLRLASGPLLWEHLEPLLALPRLARLNLLEGAPPHGDLLYGALRQRWTRERTKAAKARPARDGLAAARAEFGLGAGVSVAADGSVAVNARRLRPGGVGVLSAVPDLRALAVTGPDLPATLFRIPTLRLLSAHLTGGVTFRPEDFERLTDLREFRLEWFGTGTGWRPLRACLERLPRLCAVSLSGRGGPGAADVPPLSGLRVLHVSRMGTLAEVRELSWPGLVEWRGDVRDDRWDALNLARFSNLRLVRFGQRGGGVGRGTAPGWGDRLPGSEGGDTALSGTLAADAVRHTFDGVSLSIPAWFVPASPSAADARTPEVTPLAAWREWGDAGDDLLCLPPTRLRFERIDGDFGPDDAFGLLTGPPTPVPVFDIAGLRTAVASAPGPPAAESLEIPLAFGTVPLRSIRVVWRIPGRTYRLVCDGSPARAIPPAAVAGFVAGSVQLASVGA